MIEILSKAPPRDPGARYKVAEVTLGQLAQLRIPLRTTIQGEDAVIDAAFRAGDRLLIRARIIPTPGHGRPRPGA